MTGTTERELKARLEEPAAGFRDRLVAGGWRLRFEGEMSDRLLDTPDGRLRAADEILRLRRLAGRPGGERVVLTWKGATRYEDGFKVREELETTVAEAAPLLAVLERLGFGEVRLAIDRRVTMLEADGVRLRIEEYPCMDTLVEIEGDPARIEPRLAELGLPRSAWLPWQLDQFVERYEARTGKRARIAREDSDGRS